MVRKSYKISSIQEEKRKLRKSKLYRIARRDYLRDKEFYEATGLRPTLKWRKNHEK